MLSRLLLTVAISFYAVVVPWLELDATHVYNPAWPSHARLHEVWQLITNSAIGAAALYALWRHGAVRLAALATYLVTGGFLAAYALRASYGGSMLHTDGSERLLFGLNIGVFGFGLAMLLTTLALWLNQSARPRDIP